MAFQREYQVFGEFMVYVFGGGGLYDDLTELGLTSESIVVRPRYFHQPVLASDFGRDTPADVLFMGGYVDLYMTLVHFDFEVLQECMGLALGNGGTADGTFGPMGQPLGGGGSPGSTVNNFVSVNLMPLGGAGTIAQPWRFRQCYINGDPLEIPMGTEKSMVRINWRCIPLVVPSSSGDWDVSSDGAVIFDHELDGP